MTPDKTYFDRRYSEKGYKFKFGYDREIFSDILKYKNSGRVLDIGCGEGGLSIELARKGFQVTCLDISKKAIEEIKKVSEKESLKINLICEDLESFKIQEDFDIVLMKGILHFIGPKGEHFLSNLRHKINDEGLVLIDAFINKWLPKDRIEEIFYDWEMLEKEEYEVIAEGKRKMNYLVFRKT